MKRMIAGVLLMGLAGTAGWTQRSVPAGPVGGGSQQQGQVPQAGMTAATQSGRVEEGDDVPRSAAEKQAKLRNDERQKRIVSDTQKLLDLATQLHADVAKTDKNVLSLDVVRRAEEIEKLAHGVKERMKG